jgi:hypothetical protein
MTERHAASPASATNLRRLPEFVERGTLAGHAVLRRPTPDQGLITALPMEDCGGERSVRHFVCCGR